MLRSILFLIIGVTALAAQSFESVSIRPFVAWDDDSAEQREPGFMYYPNVSLRLLLGAAYTVRPDQIAGPEWLDTERYDVWAKPPAGATKDQVPAMLRNLLADRFHVVTHTENRERTAYALVAGPGGAKMPRTPAITGVDISVAPDHVAITGASLPAFAGLLASWLGHPVADQTGLPGSYDFRLEVSLAELKAGSPAVFAAVKELGLSLESRAVSVPYVIVDRAERPAAENPGGN